jgi:hypothetical protein
MKRSPVTSSNLKSVGYDPKTKVLEVEFVSGGLYQYLDVPAARHQALMEAKSVGSEFYKSIRNRFDYRPVKDEEKSEVVAPVASTVPPRSNKVKAHRVVRAPK